MLAVAGEWSFVAFFRGWLILSVLIVGPWAVPAIAFLGLLYAIIRAAARVESSVR